MIPSHKEIIKILNDLNPKLCIRKLKRRAQLYKSLDIDENLNIKLCKTNAFMRKVSDDILARTREKEIRYREDYLELLGNLQFTED